MQRRSLPLRMALLLRPLQPCHAPPKPPPLRVSFRRVLLGKSEAEPDVVAPVGGGGVVPIRHTTVPRVEDPATAAQHAVRATCRTLRVSLRATTIVAVPVTAPFPNIAAHVVQTQLVVRFRPHRMRLLVAVVIIPSHITDGVAAGVPVLYTIFPTLPDVLLSTCAMTESMRE